MLALKSRGCARFAQKPEDRLRIVVHPRHHQLDRHSLAELDVLYENHHPHPTGAEGRFDAVLAGKDVPRLRGIVQRSRAFREVAGLATHPSFLRYPSRRALTSGTKA